MSIDNANQSSVSASYSPAANHWFYKQMINGKTTWLPLKHNDSMQLELTLLQDEPNSKIVAVESGRFDVHVGERLMLPVYWEAPAYEVRRCSWFYKTADAKYLPYEEETADMLEQEYKSAMEIGVWRKKIALSTGEQVLMHSPTLLVMLQAPTASSSANTSSPRQYAVKRDLDAFSIEPDECQQVDHLLFVVHGIGPECGLKMRSHEEVIDDFRLIAQQLVQNNYKNSLKAGLIGRVEVLPVQWYSNLHSVELGIDEKLKAITLESIPKLRNFTNFTLLDVLFYTSPTYCQEILDTVVNKMNDVYRMYCERTPHFKGAVSLVGHSLGSIILFDLLCHQNPPAGLEAQQSSQAKETLEAVNAASCIHISCSTATKSMGHPSIDYAQLNFQPKTFFALGSPIGAFLTIRGVEKLGLDFRLPNCEGFYNVFHPLDPVAYRLETLINAELSSLSPQLIPHHKGRKRMHLELKETMARVGADLKQRFHEITQHLFTSPRQSAASQNDELVAMELNKILDKPTRNSAQDSTLSGVSTSSQSELATASQPRMSLGQLNASRRIDYVLQEAPLEIFNAYLFVWRSHISYCESEDTIFFMVRQVYTDLGISQDNEEEPQQPTSNETKPPPKT